MRFDRIRLENFKCYEDADLRLDAGVTVIQPQVGVLVALEVLQPDPVESHR